MEKQCFSRTIYDHFSITRRKSGIPKGIAKLMQEKYLKLKPKGSQNDATSMPKSKMLWCFFKKVEKCEIKLPLQREHDFTGSGHLKLHVKSIQNRYKINASRSYAKRIENVAKMEPKREPISMQESLKTMHQSMPEKTQKKTQKISKDIPVLDDLRTAYTT